MSMPRPRPAKKRLQHRCFPVNIAKVLRTLFLQNASGRLLIHLGPCKTSMMRYFCELLLAVNYFFKKTSS